MKFLNISVSFVTWTESPQGCPTLGHLATPPRGSLSGLFSVVTLSFSEFFLDAHGIHLYSKNIWQKFFIICGIDLWLFAQPSMKSSTYFNPFVFNGMERKMSFGFKRWDEKESMKVYILGI